MDKSLLNQHKQNNHNTDKSQESQFNGEANPDEIKDLNIGY